ncbi:MAG: S9 family peptidase, partial [Candidatus Dormibacteraeota bacterium]|nr:S9 family peptidase [Candidatus Dormibacteraeota bacterium]
MGAGRLTRYRGEFMPAAPWRRRFRAVQLGFPGWARDAAGRLLYSSNQTGRFELFVRDLAGGSQRQVTDRPEG